MPELSGAVAHTETERGLRTASKPRRNLLVADAPPQADEVAVAIKPLPGWARLAAVSGASILLWSLIIWAGVAIFTR